jgi:hypothetical protein
LPGGIDIFRSLLREGSRSGYDTDDQRIRLMASQPPTKDAEILLGQWLQETDPCRARALLETLIASHADPLIRRIVGFKLTSSRDHQERRGLRPDVEDVCHNALHNLLARLQRVKWGDHEPAVGNFSGYAAVVAYNACHEYFRDKRPAWARLAMRLRYLATHSPKFSLWQMEKGQQLCGFARDRGREANRDLTRLGGRVEGRGGTKIPPLPTWRS